MPKDSPGQIAKLQINTMGYSGQATPHPQSIMWVQREKVFSRWKERVVVITEDYLQCFKKGSAQLSDVGHCILKVEIWSQQRSFLNCNV